MYEYFNQFNPYLRPQSTQQLIRVTGLDGAKAYQLGPNSSVALFDESSDQFYVKSTDGAGFPTVRAFKFEPIETSTQQTNEFVTRAEFEELKGMVINNGKQSIRKQSRSVETDYTIGQDG